MVQSSRMKFTLDVGLGRAIARFSRLTIVITLHKLLILPSLFLKQTIILLFVCVVHLD